MKHRNIFDLVIVFLIAIIGTGAIIWHDLGHRNANYVCVQVGGKECE